MRKLVPLLAALLAFAPALAAQEDDLLEPEKAFAVSARAVDAKTIELSYRIADGYYLYRDKFRFEGVAPREVKLGEPVLPPGKIKQDEFFGRVETYRGTLTIRLPVINRPVGPLTFTLEATSQGCADVGVCYPPLTQTLKVALPALEKAAATALPLGGGLDALKSLGQELVGATELLPPEQAFKASVRALDEKTVAIAFVPAQGYYLYRDKLRAEVIAPAGVEVARFDLPPGEEKNDPIFGKTEIYHRPVEARVVLSRPVEKLTLEASWQGCADQGVCYLPMSKRFELTMPAGAAPRSGLPADTEAGARGASDEPTAAPRPSTEPAAGAEARVGASPPMADTRAESRVPGEAAALDETAKVVRLLSGAKIGFVLAAFFGFGLLLALTPCVFPMIPILSGIIVGQGQSLTKTHGFLLSFAYVQGMALTYAAAGVAAALSGTMLSSALQNPWVLGGFALVFVLLALSMFGFYDLQLPSALQSRLSERANRFQGGRITGVFLMGALSAVIVGPCVAAPLAGALLYIGQTGDVWLGGFALYAMALGMGVPLLLVGVAGGTLLPRAGAWMKAVKAFLGVTLLAVALWLVTPVIPEAASMLGWAALFIVSAIYLHALDPLPAGASGWKKFWKGVGVLALVYGVALLLGTLAGSRDPLQPLAGFRAAASSAALPQGAGLAFRKVRAAEFDRVLNEVRGQPVMVDFYADWCVSCKEMERFTFSDARVVARLANVALVKVDVTANDEADRALLERFKLFGPPAILFFDAQGRDLSQRVVGYQPPEKFLATLDTVFAP